MEISKTSLFTFRLLAGLWLSAQLFGCATPRAALSPIPPLQGRDVVEVGERDIFGVSPEMERFLDRYVPDGLNGSDRAWALAHATTDPMLLGFRYNPEKTLTAATAFEKRTGNCLAFSIMVVSMARHVGLDAWFQEIQVAPDWSAADDILVLSKHINVVLRGGVGEYVLDVSGRKPAKRSRVRKVSDNEAIAQFYNNLGVAALFEQDLAGAHAYFFRGINTDPDLAYIWSNLGVVYNRNGQKAGAKAMYRNALLINEDEFIAASNLSRLYTLEGNAAAAAALEGKLEKHRRRNPYYLAELAGEAAAEMQYGKSIKLLRKSIELKEKEYQFHFALAQSLHLSGNLDAAEASYRRARELAPESADSELAAFAELPAFQPPSD